MFKYLVVKASPRRQLQTLQTKRTEQGDGRDWVRNLRWASPIIVVAAAVAEDVAVIAVGDALPTHRCGGEEGMEWAIQSSVLPRYIPYDANYRPGPSPPPRRRRNDSMYCVEEYLIRVRMFRVP